jgi:hypothetical protein
VITNGVVPAGTVLNSSSQFRVPAGPCTVLLAASAGTVFVGAGTAVSALNGMPVCAAAGPPLTIPVYAGSPAQTFTAIVSSGTATLSWLVTDPTGQTGTGALG